MWKSTRALMPRVRASAPSSRTMARATSIGLAERTAALRARCAASSCGQILGAPRAVHTLLYVVSTVLATSQSSKTHCVCMRVFTTSMGVVAAAARPPATPPAANCTANPSFSASLALNSAVFALSYAAKWIAVKGTFIANVVG